MAVYSVSTSSVEARKRWSALLDAATIPRTVISKFFSETGDNVVHVHDELTRESGDNIKTFLREVITGAPKDENDSLEGQELSLTNYDFNFSIGLKRQAIRLPWKNPDAQRVPYNLRAQAKAGLQDYWQQYLDTVAFNHLCGFSPANFEGNDPTAAATQDYNGHNTITDYAATRSVFPPSETTDQGLDSTGDNFTLDIVSRAVHIAKTVHPRLRTISIPGVGSDVFVCFVHPTQVRDLKASDSEWETLQQSIIQGGGYRDSSKSTGGLTPYEGVIFVESEYVTNGVNASSGVVVADTRRAVLCGAQAMSFGFGRWHNSFSKFDWVEKTFDYENQIGIASNVMFGCKKTVYNSVDYGSVLIHTYAADAT
jgi:N4-gp56 family major capsid protein